MPPELDKDLAATMTPEELEAINAEASPEEQIVMRQAAEAASATDDDDGDDDGDGADVAAAATTADAKPDAQPAASADAEPGAGTAQADAGEPGEPAEFEPQFKVALPDDYDDQVKAVAEESRALAAKFKDGDVTFDEYNAELAKLNERRDALTEMRIKADVFKEMNQQTAAQKWQSAIDRFMFNTAKAEGIDYRKDAKMGADLDLFVKRLAADDENADKSYEWFLVEAHKRVKAFYGIGAAKSADNTPPAPKVDPVAEAKKNRKADTAAAPKTLADVPGADGPGDMGDEFTELDKLDGLELETAIAKLSPSQRERYLASA